MRAVLSKPRSLLSGLLLVFVPAFVPATVSAVPAAPPAALQQGVLSPSEPVKKARHWEQTYEFEAPTREGHTLKIRTDLGSIRVLSSEEDRVRIRIVVRTRARDRQDARRMLGRVRIMARRARDGVIVTGELEERGRGRRNWLSLEFEARVPRRYNAVLQTGGGNIEIEPLDGAVNVVTAGGNISVDAVTRLVNARTAGGNIRVGEAGADARLTTAGGMIRVGNVAGDAHLETSGGFIVGGRIGGAVVAVTAGGDIMLQAAGGPVQARTMGGQIHIIESGGGLEAESFGGSVLVIGSRGGIDVSTYGGSIDLMEIKGPVRAVTQAGRILALIEAKQAEFGPSTLQTSHGDVTVYLPEKLAFTIEAKIDGGHGHRIRSDFPLQIQGGDLRHSATVRGSGEINGGGELLTIRTVDGDIFILKITGGALQRLRRKTAIMRQRIERDIQIRLRVHVREKRKVEPDSPHEDDENDDDDDHENNPPDDES